MRDPNQQNNSSRSKLARSRMKRTARRSMLTAALIAVTSPVALGEGNNSSVRLLPPLPVQQVANQEIHANPFCTPKFRPIQTSVQLASDDSGAQSVRLKALGKAVDLKPIGGKMPTSVRPNSLTIEKTASPAVRMNPLIESEHRENRELVHAGVTPMANERLEELELTRRGQKLAPAVRVTPPTSPKSMATAALPAPVIAVPTRRDAAKKSVAILKPAGMIPALPDVPDTNAADITSALTNELDAMAAALSPPVEVATTPAPAMATKQETTAATEEPAEPTSDPVFFTITDGSGSDAADSDVTSVVQPVADEPSEVSSGGSNSDVASSNVSSSEAANEPVAALAPSDAIAELTPVPKEDDAVGLKPLDLQPLPSGMTAGPISGSLRQIDRSGNGGIVRSAPELNRSNDSTKSILSRKRFRPPVAVGAPPVAIAKQTEKAPTVTPAMQNPIIAGMPNKSVPHARRHVAPTKLHMTRAQVKSLTIGGHVRRISVTNQNVCQAVATGPNQLKLIGTGYGVTRLVVWADSTSKSPTRVRTFEIHVEDAVEASGSSVGNKTVTLNQSIEKTFPNAVVNVQSFPDRLIVAGLCDTEDEAKKIIRMVRKTCIVPVRDEIKVR